MTESNMAQPRSGQEGFTLVESLVAIVVLVFGLIAVTNLMLVAASSNTVANQGTAATTSASERMEVLRNMQFATLTGALGGSLTANVGATGPCSPAGGGAIPLPPATYNCTDDIPGVGTIVTRWQITAVPGTGRMLFIQVRSEGTGALSQRRSRADFTSLRSCTDATPVSTPGITACPDVP
jgi:prepilin-type N-terminal cleavage/methylation domain-containing protein